MSDDLTSNFRLVVMTVESASEHHDFAAAARLTEVSPDLLRYYCSKGLLGAAFADLDPALVFDERALYEIRRIEHFRSHHFVNLEALPLVCDLARHIDDLHAELRMHRSR